MKNEAESFKNNNNNKNGEQQQQQQQGSLNEELINQNSNFSEISDKSFKDKDSNVNERFCSNNDQSMSSD
jgi:U3 small nucleolar RNA-associated protein 14